MATCIVDGCKTEVTKAGHKLCLDHWKADQASKLWPCEKCGKPLDKEEPLCLDCLKKKDALPASRFMTATKVGESVGLSANRVNAILVELGWITKGDGEHGWVTTTQGKKNGGIDKEFGTGKTPFVQWPAALLSNRVFTDAVLELKGEKSSAQELSTDTKSEEVGFREKFPAKLRAADGHMVRSRGELLIDNYLYYKQIIHAYERKAPIDEDLYCDFYLPTGNVYIEYWGLEEDASYAKRKAKKLALYSANNLNLIELKDADIENIDDLFPPKLRKFGIKIE
jgi:hypothetical protein